MAEAYPLQWPAGRARTRNRKSGIFKAYGSKTYLHVDGLTIAVALKRLQQQVELLGARYLAETILPDRRSVAEVMLPQIEAAYTSGKMPPLLPFYGDR